LTNGTLGWVSLSLPLISLWEAKISVFFCRGFGTSQVGTMTGQSMGGNSFGSTVWASLSFSETSTGKRRNLIWALFFQFVCEGVGVRGSWKLVMRSKGCTEWGERWGGVRGRLYVGSCRRNGNYFETVFEDFSPVDQP